MKSLESTGWHLSKPAAYTANGGVVSAHSRVAAEIGADVLREGGNAMDAAIATSFALGASEPWMSGIGGGGCMLIQLPGVSAAHAIDFGMKAPRDLQPSDYPLEDQDSADMFQWRKVTGDANIRGATSVAIPGQVAGMALAHRTFGSLPWKRLIEPAVALAREGLLVDWYTQLILSGVAPQLAANPMMRDTFCTPDGFPKASSWVSTDETRCDMSRLADTLDLVATEGPRCFYSGALAQTIVEDLRALGGRHCMADFRDYEANLLAARTFPYRDHRVSVVPGLTAGPTLEHALNILEDGWQPSRSRPQPDADAYLAMAKALRTATAHRQDTMGDLQADTAPSCTTHLNVVGPDGTLISMTQTILSIFGSFVMLPQSGVIMNNGIMWFDPEPGRPNSLAPSGQCLANMCPVLLDRADRTRFALGAAGGRKILSSVAHLASFLLDHEMDLDTALHMPRLDLSNTDCPVLDTGLAPDIQDTVRAAFPRAISAGKPLYPYRFGLASVAMSAPGRAGALTEPTSPWADTALA